MAEAKSEQLSSALHQLLELQQLNQEGSLMNQVNAISPDDYTIVLYLPFSSMEIGAVELLKVARIAAEEINRGGGAMAKKLNILAINADLVSGRESAIFDGLVNQYGVDAVIGPMSSQQTQRLAETVTIALNLPLLPPAANANSLTFLQDGDSVFRLAPSNRQIVNRAAEFISQLGVKKVATLYRDDIFGRELAQDMSIALNQGSVNELFSQALSLAPTSSQQTMKQSILNMVAEQVDLVFLPISPEQEVSFFNLWYQTTQAPMPTVLYAEHAQSKRDPRLYHADKPVCVYSVVPDLGFMNLAAVDGIEKSLNTQNTSYTALYVYDLVYYIAAAFSYQQYQASSFGQALRSVSKEDGAIIDAFNWPNLAPLIKRGAAVKFVGASGAAVFDQFGDNQRVQLAIKSFHPFYGSGCAQPLISN